LAGRPIRLRSEQFLVPLRLAEVTFRMVLMAALIGGANGLARAQDGATATDDAAGTSGSKSEDKDTVCDLIDAAAAESRLPIAFLTRLVWRESRFLPDAISPKGAQGIAQFMPATAARRGLADPFDPRTAIPASAAYLSELAAEFGNLGLAAAAYNAGEKRVSAWIAGDGGLPWETQAYVLFVTGRAAGDWKADAAETAPAQPAAEKANATCTEIAETLAAGAGANIVPASLGSAPWAPWGVQVAGNFSQTRAMACYRALQRQFPKVIGDGPPLILRSVVASRGRAPFYAIRLPAQTHDAANDLCKRLHAAGGACVVTRNAR
jgi:hypothetical protein